MKTALRPDPAPALAVPATPTAGAIAQTLLAADAAAAQEWLRVVAREPGAAEITGALDALGVLRTDLRSLRPILEKEWTVALRDGLDAVTETLAAVHDLDGRIRLLVECRAETSPAALELLDDRARERAELVGGLAEAIGRPTRAALTGLASGRGPAPLRAAAPVGDPGLPAAVLLPPMLHRRWRKLVKETPVQDLVSMHRRATELLVVIEVATCCGLPVAGLRPATDALRTAVAAALRVAAANELRDRLPACGTGKALARIAKKRAWTTRGVEKALAAVAELGRLLPVDDTGPAKLAGGGLVVRWGAAGPEVLIVHRVRHDDWSIPKGTVVPGETVEECAVREVREETGLRCRLGQELPGVTYRDRNNRAKHVRFWHMTPVGQTGAPDPAEVDETRWVPLAHAAATLTRKRDRRVVMAFAREHGPADRAA